MKFLHHTMLLTLSISVLPSIVLNAAKLEDQAFPKSKFSFLDKCASDNGKINWPIVAQLEKMDQGTFNVDSYVTSSVMTCLDPKKNTGYVNSIKASCATPQGSHNQVKVCNAVGINLEPNPSTALQPVRTVKIGDADVIKLLDKAVPKTLLKCNKDAGNINWPVIRQLETDAVNPTNAASQINNVFKDRIDGCMDNKKNPNFVQVVESTCKLSVGSAKQTSTCQLVKKITGRPNPVADGTDTNSLSSQLSAASTAANAQITDLQGQLTAAAAASDADKAQIADLTGQLTAASTASDADKAQIADLTGQVTDLTGKLTAATSDDTSDKAQIADLQSQVTDLTGKLTVATSDDTSDKAQIADLQGQLTAATAASDADKAQITDLQGQLTAAAAASDALQKQYGDLDSYKSQLQGFADQLAAYQGQTQDWANQMNDYYAQKEQALDLQNSGKLDPTSAGIVSVP